MKTMNTIIKLLTALATVAGVIYIIATYGEQIVAWAKKILANMPKCPNCEETEEVVEAYEAPAAEETAEEAAAAEEAAEEAPIVDEPAPEVIVAEHEPVAEEADFAE